MRANQLELSYASFGRFKLTSDETLTWLDLTRQQEPILGWRLFFAWCFNELTSKPDVHPKIYTSPCRSLSPPKVRMAILRYLVEKYQPKVAFYLAAPADRAF